MIKNIVFDLGNVLISFRPSEYFDKNNYPESMKSRILSDIFGGPEWHQLDNGDINISQAIDSIARKSSLNRQEIAHIFNLRTSIMFPLDNNVRLLPGLKKEGFRLYYLSNFPLDIFEEIKSGYYFFRHFDGGIISSEVKLSKPDIRIYRLLLEKYQLLPEECLYIDDLEANVTAAEETGMRGLVTSGSNEISGLLIKALDHSSSMD
jgi:epoxide hydrolase-like predicted phosphatase